MTTTNYQRYETDQCPGCGRAKKKRAAHCRACWSSLPRQRSSTKAHAGHVYAQKHFELAERCERCLTARAVDRHHKDGNPANNVRENIASLCRRCHMELDGRLRRA